MLNSTPNPPSPTPTSSSSTTANVAPQSQNASTQASSIPTLAQQSNLSLFTMTGLIPRKPRRKIPVVTPAPSAEDEAKKARETFIDDPVACKILRELDLNDNFLNSGKVMAWALEPDDPAFLNIHEYVSRGQQDGFGVKVLTILRIMPRANHLWGDVPVLEFSKDRAVAGERRMMLWHGTKKENVASILEFGMKLPATTNKNHTFGQGIYFSDMVCKSAKACDSIWNDPRIGYLFLCDVLLGNTFQSYTPIRDVREAPVTRQGWLKRVAGYDPVRNQSVKGCGAKEPNPKGNKLIDGCVWPLGETITKNKPNQLLIFNDYIIYGVHRVQPKYLVKVEFTPKPFYETLR